MTTSKLSALRGLVILVAAVGCGTTSPKKVAPTISFVNPTAGEALNSTNGSVASGALTLAVTASTDATTGSPATLTVDGAAAGGEGSATAAGQLSLGSVSLAGSATGTSHTLVATVIDSSSGLSGSATITVTVTLTSTGACMVTISPADQTIFNETGNAVTGHTTVQDENLNQAGMQAKIVVSAGSPCTDGETVTLTVGSTPLTGSLLGGTATFDLTALPDTPDSAFTTAAQELAVSASVGSGSSQSTQTVHYLVDSVTPTLAITAPLAGATLTNAADVDPGEGGLQINVTGTSNGFAGWLAVPDTIDVAINNVADAGYTTPRASGPITLASDGTFTAEISVPNGSDTIEVFATTPSGNVASAQLIVTAAATPAITITSPTANSVINSTYGLVDGGVEVPVKMTTTASNQASVTLCSTVENGVSSSPCPPGPTGTNNPPAFVVGSGTVSNGALTINAVLGDDGSQPNQELIAIVSDGTQAAEITEEVQVHINLPVIDAIGIVDAVDAGGLLWWNASTLDAGFAQGVITVTLDAGDSFTLPDGGLFSQVNITSTVSIAGGGSAPVELVGGVPTAIVPLALADSAYPLSVSVTDIWGNPSNALQTSPISPTVDLYVKTSLPVCTITTSVPGGDYNVADNGNDAGTGDVSVPVTFSISDVSVNGLGNTPIDGTATAFVNGVSGGSVQVPFGDTSVAGTATASQGADVFSGSVTDPAGNPTQACDAGFALTVDTAAPTLMVTVLPDPSTQAATYTSTRTISMDVVTNADLPLGATFTVAIGTDIAYCTVTVVGGAGSLCTLPNAPNGTDTVVATATDAAGNQGTGSASVVVNVAGCDLTLTSPVEIPLTGGGDEVIFNTMAPTLIFHTSCPSGTEVDLTGLGAATSGDTVTASGGGSDVTFNLAGITDGSSGTFTAAPQPVVTGTTTLSIQYFTKLSSPTIGSASPGVADLVIVAYTDNPYAGTDGGPAGAGGFVLANGTSSTTSAYVTFSASSLSGLGPLENGNVGTATLTSAGSTLAAAQTIQSGATTVTFTNAALPANNYPTGQVVTLTITDNAGNATTTSWKVITDVVPPTAPNVTATMTDKHVATVSLSWTVPPAGNGTAVAGYEDHYHVSYLATALVTNPTEAQYASWTADTAIAAIAGTATSSSVTGLPTFNQYTFEVRSIDQVGNRSPLGPSASVSSVGSGTNAWQTLTIVGPDILSENGSDFGYVLKNGHFTTGQYRDLVITNPNDYASTAIPGAVYILYGTGSYASITENNTWPDSALQTLQVGTTATGADYFGYTAVVGDFNGDSIDDLAIGSPQWNGGQGRVDIFFGSATGFCGGASTCITPSVTMFGDAAGNGQFGFGLSAIGDINRDNIADLLVGAPTEGTGGTAYLFLGAATWSATPVPASTITSPYTGDGLGARWGSVPLGDVNGDMIPDFTISAPGGGIDGGAGNEYVMSGAAVLDAGSLTVPSGSFAVLTMDGGTCSSTYNYTSGLYDCFGVNGIGDVKFTSATLPDLVVSSQQTGAEYLYPMAKAGPEDYVTVNGQGTGQGWDLVSVDLNGDGKPDLLSGVNDDVGDTGYGESAYIFLNTGTGIPSTPSAVIPPTGHPTGDYFGYGLTAGDLRDQGSPDVVISDVYPLGEVTIYY